MDSKLLLLPDSIFGHLEWTYFWNHLPLAFPSLLSFLIGFWLFLLGIFTSFYKKDKAIYLSFSLVAISYGTLSLLIAFRGLIQDESILKKIHLNLYYPVLLMATSVPQLFYFLTGKKYKSVLINLILMYIICIWTGIDLVKGIAFSDSWIQYSFGKFPSGNFKIKVWGSTAILSLFLVYLPALINAYKKKYPKINIHFIIPTLLIIFFSISNFPSLLGFSIIPLGSFLFFPMIYLGYSIFKIDLFNLNTFLFKKNFLFYFVSFSFSFFLFLVACLIMYFLQPTEFEFGNKNWYYLIPLFSFFLTSLLAVFLAGTNPGDRTNIMASILLLNIGLFSFILTLRASFLHPLVEEKLEQIIYSLFSLSPSIFIRFVSQLNHSKPRYRFVLIDTLSILSSLFSLSPYFFHGYYEYEFGRIAGSYYGHLLIGLNGILVFFYSLRSIFVYPSDRRYKLLNFGFLLELIFIFTGLFPSNGIALYPLSNFSFLPGMIIFFSLLGSEKKSNPGNISRFSNRMIFIISVTILIGISLYWIFLLKYSSFADTVRHITMIFPPLYLSFFSFTFMIVRPISRQLDHNYQIMETKNKQIKVFNQELRKSKVKMQSMIQKIEKEKWELENINELNKLVNSDTNLDKVLKVIYDYVFVTYKIDFQWTLLSNPKKTKLTTYNVLYPPSLPGEIIKEIQELKLSIKTEKGSLIRTFETRKTFMATKRLVSKINLVSKFDKWLIGSLHDANKFIEIPLVLKGESIGVICFTSFDLKNNLNFQMVKKISLLIEQVVSAINNSRMISEINLAKEEAMIESRIAILAQKEAEQEREKADSLLKNILPDEILKELKEKGNVEPVLYDSATILFTDFKGFTKVAENLSPKELIKELDECFSFFDSLMDRYKLEKLKTIGDSYMCAGGIPIQNHSHSVDTILASLEIQSFMEEIQTIRKSMELPYWELRIGIHTGPVIAGIIGEKKFAYDVWGDTVNTASRMESSGYPGKINISYSTYLLIKDFFECSPRGSIEVKNKGRIEMYFVNGIKPDLSLHSEGRLPNGKFIELYESKFHT